ncbi:hypothetical protein ECANGB1_1763 [Enterospora canceri]|uniref:Uncharacterized protein n=1 Tax=Enterospora canceri TaxID=1081671 RepID=A0A1Y1S5K6_9MICR|nr:hypothetical protein ECANGB1_1763 [Enterospora canceri]
MTDRLIRKFSSMAFEEECDDHKEMIKGMDKDNSGRVLDLLLKNTKNKKLLSKYLLLFLGRVGENKKEFDIDAVASVLVDGVSDQEVLLFALEKFHKALGTLERTSLLEKVAATGINAPVLIRMLESASTTISAVVLDILASTPNLTEEFIRASLPEINGQIARNLALILPQLSAKYFVHFRHFECLLCSESHLLRCCYIDIAEKLIIEFRQAENTENISILTDQIVERLHDKSIYVRARAISALSSLFKNAAVLNNQIKLVLLGIIDRVGDKTVLVRKKAISILAQVALNSACLTDSKETGSEIRECIRLGLDRASALLDAALKTDTLDVFVFIKIAYLQGIPGAEAAVGKMISFVYVEEHRDDVIRTFREIINKKENVLFEFVNNRAFEDVIPHLELSPGRLLSNIKEGRGLFESLYVLRHMNQYKISWEAGASLLDQSGTAVFESRGLPALTRNIEMYNNTLVVLGRLSGRRKHDNPLFSLLIRNLIKMGFNEPNLIPNTVKLFYRASTGPDVNAVRLIRAIAKSRSKTKLLDAIGSVCIEQYSFIELIERRIKVDVLDQNIDQNIDQNNKQRRIDLKSRVGPEPPESAPKKQRRNSLADSATLRYRDLCDLLRAQGNEEITDFFDHQKEHEILNGDRGVLGPLIPFVVEECHSKNSAVCYAANVALAKCIISSRLIFDQYFTDPYLINLFDQNQSPILRNTLVSFLGDIVIYYSSAIETDVLFSLLSDATIKLNGMLLIHSLIAKNVLRIRSFSRHLLIHHNDDQIGGLVRRLIGSNEQSVPPMIYEAFLVDEIPVEAVEYLCRLIQGDGRRLIEKCGAVEMNGIKKEKMEIIRGVFSGN